MMPLTATRTVLPDWLAYQAAGDGGARLAVADSTVRWSFAALACEVDRWAGHLRARGVGPGDRMALLMGNSAAFTALVHAAIRLGAVLVPLNVRLTQAELAWQLADCGARLLIHDAARAEAAIAAGADVPGVGVTSLSDLAAGTPMPLPVHAGIDLDQVQAVIYTSGTTGQPKGSLLTYGNVWWSAVGSALNLGTQTDDRWLACLPLFHVGGLSILMRSVIYGVPVLVHETFDPVAVNAAIDREGVTIISVVSTMLGRMLDARGDHRYPDTLRAVLLGGGPAPGPLLERCARAGVPVVQTYGLTETASQVATLAPGDALRKLGSAGRPLLPTRIRIAGPLGDVAPGTVGEILVQGPTVTPGYLNRPDATAAAIRDGWLHTGDLGYLDADGYLTVVDRRDDLIISGGENIYPAEVEAVVLAHPAVAEAAVVGVPDRHWGQRVRAIVALRPGAVATAEEMRDFCRARLAR
ncbi:MAG TPA: o-succinylbenzoate--CoA ligase, partial [Chloroflexia bacterium]|nr:o-succinylbenzoate--CoA ligase [Chloroflexia bacterium]